MIGIPSWNGHLKLSDYCDNSVLTLYNEIQHPNKMLVPVIKNDIWGTSEIIEREVSKQKEKCVFITGDHSNTYSIIKGVKKGQKFKVVIFDAHPDCEVDCGVVSHEDFVRCLVEEEIVRTEDIYLFGIRRFSRLEFEYLQDKKIKFWTMKDVLEDKEKIREILLSIQGDVYLSVDVDVLDVKDAPGTFYREDCGLYIDELVEFVRCVKDKIFAVDLTEFYKENDDEKITEKNVLRLILEFLKNG